MKKWIVYLWCLVAVVGAGTGCSDDEKENSWFAEIDNEQIVSRIEDAPAYVYATRKDYVFINYSEHADDYFINNINIDTCVFDIIDCMIGVSLADFNKYNIPIGSKVYITAEITNNNEVITEGMFDPGYDMFFHTPKAYLINIRIRE